MTVIKTKNLTKKFGNFLAVNELNITVEHGQVYGFIGKNGAGKTTTINMILSLIKATNGQVFINDELVDFKDSSYKQKIGFVSDVPVFPNHMNAKEYLIYVGELFGIKGVTLKESVFEVLKFVGLDNTKKLVKSYSRGMKQRLAIAASLVNDPDILIMDEPTSALDPIGRKQVIDIIDKLRGKKTIFYSTHILNDVERVCDSVCLIDKGNIIVQDTVENIKKHYYLNRYLVDTNNNVLLKGILINSTWIKYVDNHKEGLIFEYSDEDLYKEKFLALLIDNNIHLNELRKLNMNLEDIFVKVVNHEDAN
ncbi:ABC transporter ATP-binding protein [Mycoplasmatota bacterium WC44]